MEFLKKNIGYIIILGWVLMIFSFSSQNGRESSTLSRGITKNIVGVIKKVEPKEGINSYKFNKKLRKVAHYLNYMTFSLILFFTFRRYGVKKAIIISLIIALITAMADEFYQSFIPGREGRIKDVLIDFVGALTGSLIALIMTLVKKR